MRSRKAGLSTCVAAFAVAGALAAPMRPGPAAALLLVLLALPLRRQALRPMSTIVSPQPPAPRALPQARPGPAKPALARAAVTSRQTGVGARRRRRPAKAWACGGEMRQAGWGGRGRAGNSRPGVLGGPGRAGRGPRRAPAPCVPPRAHMRASGGGATPGQAHSKGGGMAVEAGSLPRASARGQAPRRRRRRDDGARGDGVGAAKAGRRRLGGTGQG